jgi:hypothetical protein
MGAVLICAAIYVALLPIYQTEEFRFMRLVLTLISIIPYAAGVLLAIPLVHGNHLPSSYYFLLGGLATEMCAGGFYVSMFPEKVFPLCCDNYFASHQLWHWINFGFDTFMMLAAYESFKLLESSQSCYFN